MSTKRSTRSTVRHTPLKGKKVPDALTALDDVCTRGSGCTAVQNDPIASAALGAFKTAVSNAHTSLTKRVAAAGALAAAIKALAEDMTTVYFTLTRYESAVNVLANGSAATITAAGLLARDPSTATSSELTRVSAVLSKLGKNPGEAVITWPQAPGATGYAIEVNFTPQNPTGPYTALNSGTGRRRIVKAPTPGAQFLVRIASLDSNGNQSEWSDAILATAR